MKRHVGNLIVDDRILQGKLTEGIEIGINICKVCNNLKLNDLKLAVLPSLIEIMVKPCDLDLRTSKLGNIICQVCRNADLSYFVANTGLDEEDKRSCRFAVRVVLSLQNGRG